MACVIPISNLRHQSLSMRQNDSVSGITSDGGIQQEATPRAIHGRKTTAEMSRPICMMFQHASRGPKPVERGWTMRGVVCGVRRGAEGGPNAPSDEGICERAAGVTGPPSSVFFLDNKHETHVPVVGTPAPPSGSVDAPRGVAGSSGGEAGRCAVQPAWTRRGAPWRVRAPRPRRGGETLHEVRIISSREKRPGRRRVGRRRVPGGTSAPRPASSSWGTSGRRRSSWPRGRAARASAHGQLVAGDRGLFEVAASNVRQATGLLREQRRTPRTMPTTADSPRPPAPECAPGDTVTLERGGSQLASPVPCEWFRRLPP
ncbi:uncharacterized protein SOCE26_015710 [Sorangium cellulosum]|uniref:Uncharacterized protein n=1 Tax=Sorangium cellulosum TaxID=56 RepID=A0A2L0ELN7_SORCE|nr:uncharacterized protein SOCE26_015710 [Sorangium cellulosum]